MEIKRYADATHVPQSKYDSPDCKPTYDVCDICEPVCCEPKCKDPCPTFRARDAYRIKEFEVERLFDIRSHCGDRAFYPTQRCIRMEIKRVEACSWLCSMDALSVDGDGLVRFRWPNSFLCAAPGYYIGRVLVDGKHTIDLILHKPFVKHNVHSTKAVESELCGSCHAAPCCCGSRPQQEQDYYHEDTDCGGCDAGHC